MQDRLIRIKLGSSELDLPAAAEVLCAAAEKSDLNEINLNDVQFHSLNEQGDDLLAALSPYESIAATNLACTLLTVPGVTASARQVVESALRLLPQRPTEPMDFFYPISLRIEDGEGNMGEGDRWLLLEHEDDICFALREAVPEGENMAWHMEGCSRELRDKVASAVWDAGKFGGDIYGIVRCELRELLTAEEKEELTEWIKLQNDAGIGARAEQIPLEAEEGTLFVGCNANGPDNFVYDREQFTAHLNGDTPAMTPAMTPESEQITFYCPLTVSCYDDDGEQEVELGNKFLVWYKEEIRTALRAEIREGENMAQYLDPSLQDKVASVEWDIEVVNGTAYGKITCELTEPLDMDEQAELASWISGQNSDGLGEGFEQRPVKTGDGELFVHLWDFDDNYYVLPEDEFQAQVLEQSQGGQGFGGMEGMA